MGNASVYATSYNGHYVYADVSWDEDLKVTVKITDVNAGWCIKIRGTSTQKCSGSMSNRTGSFYADEGQDYVLQVYDAVEGSFVNEGDPIFTVSNYSGGDSGDSGDYGDDDFDDAYRLFLYEGVGTKLTVFKIWDESTQTRYSLDNAIEMHNGDEIVANDCFVITAEALDGYELVHYTYSIFGAEYELPYDVTNLVDPTDDGAFEFWVFDHDDATVTTKAEPPEYSMSISDTEHVTFKINRKSTMHSTAKTGPITTTNKIYLYDILKITCTAASGYTVREIYVNGVPISNGGTYSVTGNIVLSADVVQCGVIYIDNGSEFVPYQCYIDNGSSWDLYIPYIDNGTSWNICN